MIDQNLSSGSGTNLFTQKVDPRAKLLLLLLFYLLLIITPSGQFFKLTVCAFFLSATVVTTKLPPASLIRFLLKIYPMIMIVSLMQIMNAPGYAPLHTGRTFLGLATGIWLTVLSFQIKSLLALTAGYLVMASTSPTRIVSILHKLRLPGPFVAVMFFAYQFLFICTREFNRLLMSLRSRYIELSHRRRLKLAGHITITYFMRLLERSEGLNRQLLSRGFNGTVPLHKDLHWQRSDSFILAGMGILIFFIFFTI